MTNRKYPALCIDHLQRDQGHHYGSYTLGQYPCHQVLGMTKTKSQNLVLNLWHVYYVPGSSQYFSVSKGLHEFRNEYSCAEARASLPVVDHLSGSADKVELFVQILPDLAIFRFSFSGRPYVSVSREVGKPGMVLRRWQRADQTRQNRPLCHG